MGHTVLTPYSSNWVVFIDEALPWVDGCVHMYLLILNWSTSNTYGSTSSGNAGFNSISSVNFNSNTDIIIPEYSN